jgi:hypothetical protein
MVNRSPALMPVALLGILTGLTAGEAVAATVSVDVGTEIQVPSGVTAQPTLGLRLGQELDLKVARIVPEVGLVGIPQTSFVGIIAGGRVSILRLIEPGAFAHLGYGGAFGEEGWLTFDGGLQLDLAISKVRAGIHAGTEIRKSGSSIDPFLVAGIHTGYVF